MGQRVEIIGRWIQEGSRFVADQCCKVIEHLISDHFVKVGEREGGWTTLYQDPTDQSYWERTYPHSEMHGGGPPTLTKLSVNEVKEKYGETVP